ncbi:MAG: methyl-accepting chemotaxis protein [Spirochaetes bacterium]|nr:methyl-accepting chemotaxis protein [Spirochaetota bacterium]
MKNPKGSVAAQVLSLCIGLVVVSVVASTLIFTVNLGRVQRQDFAAKALVTMQFLNADLHRVLSSYTGLVETAAAVINNVIEGAANHGAIEAAVRNMSETIPEVAFLYYHSAVSRFHPDGLFVDSTGWEPSDDDWDGPNTSWHQAAMANPGQVRIVDPYVDAAVGELVITVSTVARRADGSISGVMAADVMLLTFADIVLAGTISADGTTVLIDSQQDGLFVVHPDPSFKMTRNIFTEMPHLDRGTILSGQTNVLFDSNNYVVFSPVHGTDWILVSMGSLSEQRSEFFAILRYIIMSGIFVVAMSSFAAYVYSRSLTNPIKGLFGVLKANSSGDLTQKIETRGDDEISQMAILLNNTQEGVKKLIVNIKNEAGLLSRIGGELAGDMNVTSSSMSEINTNARNIKERILNQSASVTQTHATMEQVVSNIDKLNDYIEKQSDTITQATHALEEMVESINSVTGTLIENAANVTTLQEASEAGRSGLTAVSVDIKEIARESEGLLEINSVMDNLASQTNLLSMNAAIQAAHAGEAGKGFAVVAGEIRKLAENSSAHSRTISAVLKKIKSSIDKITGSTENVRNRFEAIDSHVKIVAEQEENIRSAMERQGAGSKRLLDSMENVNEITGLVKSGSSKMLEGAQEVIRESKNLENATVAIKSDINEMAASAEHINSAMNNANDRSKRNSEAINTLVREVSQFKTD